MTRLKLLAGLVGAVALVAALLVVNGWRKDAAVLNACVAAVATDAKPSAEPGQRCPSQIAADHQVASKARACDTALSAKPENTYGVGAYCSTQVKTVQAERDVARGEARRLTEDLTNERQGQDAAIARASASATALAERKARAAAAVQAAPRDGAGLVVCDAQCVRDRWGGAGERP